ncbi:hypothetical protein GA0070607_3001 [Micromonospora coriariae]|uniref:Uncharacterized protein n=1 Tax=Micromonospora coriariae TaxID=285665 RepID=A0A1C4W1U5_9ACTN|nr:hypothetical protein [Micromonospora coriariae]SCE90138.1 hypothetical protein GA0070607_3001 [Micromonospora coriariae]
MRGDLDETLARLARREEALRRRANDRAENATPPGPAGAPADLGNGRTDARNAGPGRHAGRDTPGEVAGWGPVEEVAEAVRQVVGAHPGLAVTVRVEHAGRTYPLLISWDGAHVTVGPEPSAAPVEPPPAWPLSGRTVPAWAPGPNGLTPDPAARLAELIRRDPSLLDELDPRR